MTAHRVQTKTQAGLLAAGKLSGGLRGLELISGIAHDLKTPLATIATSAELLEQDVDGETSSHLIKVIQRQAERLNLMVAELSEHLRKDSSTMVLHPHFFDLGELLAETANDFRRVETGHELRIELPSEVALISGDYGKIKRIVENLLRNAFIYTPAGKTVILRLTPNFEGSQRFLIEVEDEGPGIPAALRDRVFEAFFRVKDHPDNGQGLGLYMVKLLTEAHNGCAWVEEAPAGGALFRVALPSPENRLD
jgi:signal transduction histidine kinase